MPAKCTVVNDVDLPDHFGQQKKPTTAQIALAWILAKSLGWLGTTKLHRLEENIGAADVALTASELGNAASNIAIQGELS